MDSSFFPPLSSIFPDLLDRSRVRIAVRLGDTPLPSLLQDLLPSSGRKDLLKSPGAFGLSTLRQVPVPLKRRELDNH